MPPPVVRKAAAANDAMKLFLLPISTRRSLIYCEPMSHTKPVANQSYVEWGINKASTTWVDWEKDTKAPWRWKKRITEYGNLLFRRIPFEEWGLKTIPPLPKLEPGAVTQHVEVRYPRIYQELCHLSLMNNLKRIATERQSLHRNRLVLSIVAMPFTIPVGLLPVIPNLPLFYLIFRAYSHYKALKGSRHLEHLLNSSAIVAEASPPLDELYTAGLHHLSLEASRVSPSPSPEQTQQVLEKLRKQIGGPKEDPSPPEQQGERKLEESQSDEVMLLRQWNGALIAEKLGLPGLQIEVERAVEQVETSIRKAKEAEAEKKSHPKSQ